MNGSVLTTLVTAGSMILASVFTSYATANNSIADIRQNISVVEERENNHYTEIQKNLDRIELKLDKVLK